MCFEEFIGMWKSCSTLNEFCEKTGMNNVQANVKAWGYRQKGIVITKLPYTPKLRKQYEKRKSKTSDQNEPQPSSTNEEPKVEVVNII